MAISGDGSRIQDKAPDTPRNRGDYDAPHLTPITPAEDIRSIALNRISGTAVLVGAAMALVVQIIMNLFGASFGLSYSGDNAAAGNVTAEDVALGGLLWWAFAGIIAAFIGGLTAGRASGEPKANTAGWNGLGSWAVSVLVVAVLVSITGSVVAAQNNDRNNNSIFYGQYMVPRGVNLGMNNTGSAANDASSRGTVTGTMQGSAVSGEAAGSRAGAGQTTGNDSAGSASVDAQTASRIALISAIALVLGALAAWFGGCAGAVDPTITDRDLRRNSSYH
jgi:hypothetical protein